MDVNSSGCSTVTVIGNNVTFTLGKGSRVMTTNSIFIEGIDFYSNEKVIIKDGKIFKEHNNDRTWRKFFSFLSKFFN